MRSVKFVVKIVLFFLLVMMGWVALQPMHGLGKISLYNALFRGRARLPFGESPREAYNFSLDNLDAMFASHEIAGARKNVDEFRVIMIGDSSVWGTLLKPSETLAGQLNGREITLSNGENKRIRAFNLGYPTLSLAKDMLILNRAMEYAPDLIIWSLTMEAFPDQKQLSSPLANANANANELRKLLKASDVLPEWLGAPALTSVWNRTLIGQRRQLFDWLRLQLYGAMWSATGIDQLYPADYARPKVDLERDNAFQDVDGIFPDAHFAWQMVAEGKRIAGAVPLLILNEPMLISDGENSDIRYNFYYPIEAYDAWHQALLSRCDLLQIDLLDAWNLLENARFTNSAIHYDADGAARLSTLVFNEIDGKYDLQK